MNDHVPDELDPAGRDLRAYTDELRPEHRREPLLRVAHGDEDALALLREGESLGRAHRRLPHAALVGHDEEALVIQPRLRWRRT